jgi:hypothetical protein
MLTNFQLEELAVKIKVPLVGVYSKNELPKVKKNGGYIFNLQDSEDEHGKPLPGTHWVGAWVEDNRSVYFDSFGFPAPVSVKRFLGKNYVWSDKVIQNVRSEICGYYCLYFLWFMSRNRKLQLVRRFQLFTDKFSDDVTDNKRILQKLIKPL